MLPKTLVQANIISTTQYYPIRNLPVKLTAAIELAVLSYLIGVKIALVLATSMQMSISIMTWEHKTSSCHEHFWRGTRYQWFFESRNYLFRNPTCWTWKLGTSYGLGFWELSYWCPHHAWYDPKIGSNYLSPYTTVIRKGVKKRLMLLTQNNTAFTSGLFSNENRSAILGSWHCSLLRTNTLLVWYWWVSSSRHNGRESD